MGGLAGGWSSECTECLAVANRKTHGPSYQHAALRQAAAPAHHHGGLHVLGNPRAAVAALGGRHLGRQGAMWRRDGRTAACSAQLQGLRCIAAAAACRRSRLLHSLQAGRIRQLRAARQVTTYLVRGRHPLKDGRRHAHRLRQRPGPRQPRSAERVHRRRAVGVVREGRIRGHVLWGEGLPGAVAVSASQRAAWRCGLRCYSQRLVERVQQLAQCRGCAARRHTTAPAQPTRPACARSPC